MKEVEILVKVLEPLEAVISKMKAYHFIGKKETVDKYFFDPLRDNLKPDSKLKLHECIRLRKKDNHQFVTYKIDHFDQSGLWVYSDEFECGIESVEIIENILYCLGLKELVTIQNTKYTYCVDDLYEIVVEDVVNLGVFLEVEAKLQEDIKPDEVQNVRHQIQSFIDTLKIKVSPELNIGKPELMLRQSMGHKIA